MLFVILVTLLFGVTALVRRDGAPLSRPARPWVGPLVWGLGLAALLVRFVGFDRSLWIDEFGTLWTIEGSLHDTWSRALTFQGQSPFYYFILWPWIRAFGESEAVLRIPSLIFGAAAVALVSRTAVAIGSKEAGLFAAMLLWTTPVLSEFTVSARPYALAMAFAALAFHGFLRAVSTAARSDRMLFVAGGVGLFLTHYVSALVMAGLAIGYVIFRDLRARYRWRMFLTDVALQLAVLLAMLPQLSTLWHRRATLEWIGPPDFFTFVSVIGPALLPAATAVLERSTATRPPGRSVEALLAVAAATQLVGLALLALFGSNLLAPRYLMVMAIPASLLAGLALSRLRTPAALISIVFAVSLVTTVSLLWWRSSGVAATPINEDWRGAVQALNKEIGPIPGGVVLYRSGFVEQEPGSASSTVLAAPLRSPGLSAPHWPIVPLTFSWWSAAREPYFREVVIPALGDVPVFFVLTAGTTPRTGNYPQLLLDWVHSRFPDQFVVRSLGDFRGVTLLRFDRRASQPQGDRSPTRGRSSP